MGKSKRQGPMMVARDRMHNIKHASRTAGKSELFPYLPSAFQKCKNTA